MEGGDNELPEPSQQPEMARRQSRNAVMDASGGIADNDQQQQQQRARHGTAAHSQDGAADNDGHGHDDESIEDGASVAGDTQHGSGSQKSGASNNNSSTTSGASDQTTGMLAQSESKHVGWLRIVVFGALLIATGSLSAVMYTSSQQSLVEQFELQFRDHSASILDAFEIHWREGLIALDTMAVSVLSHVQSLNELSTVESQLPASKRPWPQVTIPHFARRAASARRHGMFTTLTVVSVVFPEDRVDYEDHVIQNLGWMEEGRAYEEEIEQDKWQFGNFPREEEGNGQSRRSLAAEDHDGLNAIVRDLQESPPVRVDPVSKIVTNLWGVGARGPFVIPYTNETEADGVRPMLPAWQIAPVDVYVNLDFSRVPSVADEMWLAYDTKSIIISKAGFISEVIETENGKKLPDSPTTAIRYPLIQTTEDPTTGAKDNVVVGFLGANIFWDAYMQVGQLPSTANHIQVVLENTCNQSFTFKVMDGDILFEGEGDLHDRQFDDYLDETFELRTLTEDTDLLGFGGVTLNSNYCPYTLHVYPTETMKKNNMSSSRQPWVYTALVIAVFLMTSIIFVGYDRYVERRQKVVMKSAVKSHAIVSSLFPKSVQQRLYEESDTGRRNGAASAGNNPHASPGNQKAKLKSFMRNTSPSEPLHKPSPSKDMFRVNGMSSGGGGAKNKTKPIADLFSNTTVLFADIAGFTAWSSTREPSQVFTLLEAIYGSFDRLAERRKVFKVETIGDCYMAVTGLPDPQPDHAVIMARFATAILLRMQEITHELEVELGPDTNELSIRVGLHSGPVTAGVLRGQKSRFQLFGDTVNMASRMETTGCRNQIQCSQETCDLLMTHGKEAWIAPRKDMVEVKGKGTIQTYWVQLRRNKPLTALPEGSDTASTSSRSSGKGPSRTVQAAEAASRQAHIERLLEWNVDLLSRCLRRVVARRLTKSKKKGGLFTVSLDTTSKRKSRSLASSAGGQSNGATATHHSTADTSISSSGHNMPRDEYQESIRLPSFAESLQSSGGGANEDINQVQLSERVQAQLHAFVSKIAHLYQDNPFHNYSHASHVTMSTNKILMRIVSTDEIDITHKNKRKSAKRVLGLSAPRSSASKEHAARLHDYTYGITSDPMTHFACIFAALIHDVDHPGVPNAQLIREGHGLASKYQNKSVAEQNSIDVAWNLLMEDEFMDLQDCLFEDESAQDRFRQLVVNIVMATDIFDPELVALRNKRWQKAFAPVTGDSNGSPDSTNLMDLKATIVIEHILQAADVSHTMQHWHVYQKWNRRLFHEMYGAYHNNRLETDPSEGWFEGELWFFDNYVIPLASKLNECGVFGVSSDEFLTYAQANREEWERKGKDIVEDMKNEFDERSVQM